MQEADQLWYFHLPLKNQEIIYERSKYRILWGPKINILPTFSGCTNNITLASKTNFFINGR